MVDKKDLAILEELKNDSKQTTSQISRKTRIPITTVHNRIKKMEQEGIIKGYTVRLDYPKLGKDIAAYLLVTITYTLPSGKKISQREVARKISQLKPVESVEIVAGGTDIIIKARTKDVEELNTFVIDELRSIDGVDKTQTMVVLSSFS